MVSVEELQTDIDRQRTEAMRRLDADIRRESELAVFDADSVADLLRHVI